MKTYDAAEVAELLHTSRGRVYALAHRARDPLPMMRIAGTKRGMFTTEGSLAAWMRRNCPQVQESGFYVSDIDD